MTPLGIIIAALAILTVDYCAEVYLRRKGSRHPFDYLEGHTNPLLRNTLYHTGPSSHKHV